MGSTINPGFLRTGIKAPSRNEIVGDSRLPQYYQSSLVVFILFIGFVIFRYLEGGVRYPALGVIRFEFLMGALLGALAFQAYRDNHKREGCGVGPWVSLLFMLMVIMVVSSYNQENSYEIFIDRVVKFGLLAFFIAAFVTTPRRLAWFVGAFMFACLKMGEEGFLGNIMGTMVWENQGVIRLHGSTPIYNHPNSFAGMALGCLPFILYFYRFIPGYLQAVLLVQFVLMLNIIVFTGSRTGYIGCMIMLVFLIWKSKNRRRALLAVLPLVVALAYLVPQQYIERAETLTVEKEGEGGSVDARLQILRDAWQVFLDNPLGVGVQAFPAVRKSRFGRQQDTHNLYLEVATNLGIQGLIIFLGFITALLRVLTRLVSSINRQINQLEKEIAGIRHGNQGGKQMGRHLLDLRIMLATGKAVYLFLIIRLSLGIFGHDLYEIYWWFALGTTVAVWNLNTIARSRTEMLCCSDNSEGRIFTPALRTGKMSKQAWKRFLVKKLPGQHEKDGNDARKRDDPAK